MKYQCLHCEKVHRNQNAALKCCEYLNKQKIEKWECTKCSNMFKKELYALVCCREKKIREYRPKGVWIKIDHLDDIPKEIVLFGADCDGDFHIFDPWRRIGKGNKKDDWQYYMIPIDLPDKYDDIECDDDDECPYGEECDDCDNPC